MTTMMLALTNAISVGRRSPSPTNALLLDDIEVGSFWWLTYAGISCFLVLFAGIMSGLTLGLMSLGLVDLEILQRSGTSQEKKQAATILPVVKKQHQLLVTLLLCNACAMEALPICLDKIFHPLVAVILSVTFVLAFGEVIPQAICTRYGLAVCTYCHPYSMGFFSAPLEVGTWESGCEEVHVYSSSFSQII